MSGQVENETPQVPQMALAVVIVLFVGLFVWGFVLSIAEQAQRGAPGDSLG